MMDFFGNAAFKALDSLVLRGESAKDVMAGLVTQLARAALQASLLGSGPLAGLFGGGGGLIGSFAGAFAHGGRIPGGQFGIVGERGPEIVRGPAMVQPMRGGRGGPDSVTINAPIDARGAERGVDVRIASALEQFRRALPGMIRDEQNRGRV